MKLLSFAISILLLSSNARGLTREAKTLFVEGNLDFKKSWMEVGETQEESLKELFVLLISSPTGKEILGKAQEKAAEQGLTLQDIVLPGGHSITDTTLIRKFTPDHPDNVVYETKSVVYLNKSLGVKDAVLDMAHELTHYVYRSAFNPYRSNFTLPEFVKSTVEGRGGEVEAYLVECKVLMELFKKDALQNSNCQRIVDENTGHFSKEKGIEQFYRVGEHWRTFEKELKDYQVEMVELPKVSQHNALFISSAYGLPYPLAAVREYKTIMGKACQNDFNRLTILKNTPKRGVASNDVVNQRIEAMSKDYASRCQNFLE